MMSSRWAVWCLTAKAVFGIRGQRFSAGKKVSPANDLAFAEGEDVEDLAHCLQIARRSIESRPAQAHDHMLPDLDPFDGLDDQWRSGEAVSDDAHHLLPPIGAQAGLKALPHQIRAKGTPRCALDRGCASRQPVRPEQCRYCSRTFTVSSL
jgi:hypothetical protein